jgi:hypothetical protein
LIGSLIAALDRHGCMAAIVSVGAIGVPAAEGSGRDDAREQC